MFDTILQSAAFDPGLAHLINTAGEYAEIYSLSRDRQKGCDGNA